MLYLEILLLLLFLHVIIKFAFFFVLSYETRRKMLDRSYSGKISATKKSDIALLIIALLPLLLLVILGKVEYISFAVGLYLGMTLIQVYFHKFSAPLSADKEPQDPISPIKIMSYAIQANPERAWVVLAIITLLVIWILYELITKAFGWV